MLSLTKAITSDPIDQNSVLHTLPISVNKQKVLIHRAEDIHQDIPHHHQSNPLIAQLEICIKRFTAHTMGSQWLGALPRLAKLRRPAQVGSWGHQRATRPSSNGTLGRRAPFHGRRQRKLLREPGEQEIFVSGHFQRRNLRTNLQSSRMH